MSDVDAERGLDYIEAADEFMDERVDVFETLTRPDRR